MDKHVTEETLQDKMDLVRAEQKTEHIKTRALVLIASAPGWLKASAAILGYFGAGWFF